MIQKVEKTIINKTVKEHVISTELVVAMLGGGLLIVLCGGCTLFFFMRDYHRRTRRPRPDGIQSKCPVRSVVR